MPTDKLLLESAKALAEAFDQEWIINARKTLLQSCEAMIPLLDN